MVANKDRDAELIETLRGILLDNVGKPDDLWRVDIIPLHDKYHFRANMYRPVDNEKRITDSFYLTVKDGDVFASPPLVRKYWDDVLDIVLIEQECCL